MNSEARGNTWLCPHTVDKWLTHGKVKTNTEIRFATSRAHFLLFVLFINHAFCCPMHLFCSAWPCWQCKHQARGATVRLRTQNVGLGRQIDRCLWPLAFALINPHSQPPRHRLCHWSDSEQMGWFGGRRKGLFCSQPSLSLKSSPPSNNLLHHLCCSSAGKILILRRFTVN